ncbi:MAG TPA: hypothetical protein VKE69_00900, partial [Planctomycetota bacterium]|nr:hypothetical protein [Planctomycetota bacterium]
MRPAARIVFAIAALALLIVVVASLLVRERASDTSESSAAAAPSRSVAASAPSDASRVAKAEPSATASLPAANAELQLLSIGDLRPAARSRWRIANAESPAREVRASDDGRLDVPSGMWSFESADAEWRAVDAVAEAKEGSTEIVWVSRIGTRAFRCVDVDGRPVEGVTALWFPREGLPQSDTMPPDVPSCATAKSDASGLVSLSGCPADSGTAVFLDPRFEREIRSFSG